MTYNSDKKLKTVLLAPDDKGIKKAAMLIKQEGLIAFPTETVYGLGADATNRNAVEKIYIAKARPQINPLIVHVRNEEEARSIGEIPAIMVQLIDKFWPGPLTLVIKKNSTSKLTKLLSSGLETVAIRNPSHLIAQKLLESFGGPIAAPSANLSGKISGTRASDVLEDLDGRIDGIINAGVCPIGIESTIVCATENKINILRPGAISYQQIVDIIGLENIKSASNYKNIESPGQLNSHYAPDSPLRLNALTPKPNEVFLSFGPLPLNTLGISLSEHFDITEVAVNLFSALHKVDSMAKTYNADGIAISPIPNTGIGYAINDRLKRAAYENSLM